VLIGRWVPFSFAFYNEGEGVWTLDTRFNNTIERNCSLYHVPDMCVDVPRLKAIISGYSKDSDRPIDIIKVNDFYDNKHETPLSGKEEWGIAECHRRSVYRALQDLNQRSRNRIFESDKKIEDYIRDLNSGGIMQIKQYGTLLYDTGDLVIPWDRRNWLV